MPNPWVYLRHDKLILVNKVVNEKEQLEKMAGGGEKSSNSKLERNNELCRRLVNAQQGCQMFICPMYQNQQNVPNGNRVFINVPTANKSSQKTKR
jgi:hypothetical protein